MSNNNYLQFANQILKTYDDQIKYYSNLLQTVNEFQITGDCYWALASIYLNFKTKTTKTKFYIEKSKEFYSLVQNKNTIIRGPFLIKITESEYYYKNSNHKIAKDILNSSLELITLETYFFSIIWFYLSIQIIIDENGTDIEHQITSLIDKVDNTYYDEKDKNFENEMSILKLFLESLILKHKKRFFHKGKSMDLMHSIVFKESVFQEIIIVQYFELLIDEIKIYNQIDSIREFKELLKQLIAIASSTNNFLLLMQSFFLEQLILLVTNDDASYEEIQKLENIISQYPEFNLIDEFNKEKEKFFEIVSNFAEVRTKIDIDRYHSIQTLQLTSYVKDMYKIMQQNLKLK